VINRFQNSPFKCNLHRYTQGKLKVVDYLLSVGANVSIQDRWSGTPLEDAVGLCTLISS
jgi:hypothetical protein